MTATQRKHRCVILLLLSWALSVNVADVFAQALSFEPVGTIPGPADLVKSDGKYAYITANKTLTVFDVSNPAAPKRVGDYSFPDRILGFRLAGSLVYVAADLYGLGILDVSGGGIPKLRGSLKTPGSAKNVTVAGRTVVVADQVSGLDIVDVSDPAKPVQVDSVFLEGYATDVVTSGSLAYAADMPTGFSVLDLSKPGSLGNWGNHIATVQLRQAELPPESHDGFSHVLIFTSGSGSVTLGGEIVDGPDGKKMVRGGDTQRIMLGAVYHIPFKVVHQVTPDPGVSVTYFVVNINIEKS